ncbi:ABC transporter permease [Alkalimonas delamerensis]|uniref:Transport permease protein n=1 Tax=Alkalimonas delamerensis TaxID=265981 RepID=A0ABT9GQ40_9GAMM|nr:ABC transporter permease [Alkalimonas delamerensis]MDP4529014.1 ABC transporter permease [Alkalimonas delamerensis]
MKERSSLQVTLHVWHALFMREAMARMTGDRFGWTWMLLEPIAHIMIMITVREFLGRVRFIPGADFIPFLIVGIMGFLLFRNSATRSMSAINANGGLFAYRQVHPVDTVLVRAALEATFKSIIFMILVSGAAFLGMDIIPHHVLKAIQGWLTLWLLGLGLGLLFSVVVSLVQEAQKIIGMLMFPLYFLSGVIIPVQFMPRRVQEYLIYNPILHSIESMRYGFFPAYRSIEGINLLYPLTFALIMILLGLMLQIRLKARLIAQ